MRLLRAPHMLLGCILSPSCHSVLILDVEYAHHSSLGRSLVQMTWARANLITRVLVGVQLHCKPMVALLNLTLSNRRHRHIVLYRLIHIQSCQGTVCQSIPEAFLRYVPGLHSSPPPTPGKVYGVNYCVCMISCMRACMCACVHACVWGLRGGWE